MIYEEKIEWHKIEFDENGKTISEMPKDDETVLTLCEAYGGGYYCDMDEYEDWNGTMCFDKEYRYDHIVVAWAYLPKGGML